jgi:hypothetical protein
MPNYLIKILLKVHKAPIEISIYMTINFLHEESLEFIFEIDLVINICVSS